MLWLDYSRIVAIFSVILLHVSSALVNGNDIYSEIWWVGNLYNSIVTWCVPVFVMISGALLLSPDKNEEVIVFYKKRLSRILLPIITWSLIFLFWHFFTSSLRGNQVTAIELLKSVATGRPHYHMWYLYMIIGLYVFTPYLRLIIKHASRENLLILTALTFFLAIINLIVDKFIKNNSTPFIFWFLPYIPYFILGHLIRESNKKYSKPFLWTTFIASFITTSVGCYIISKQYNLALGSYFYEYLSITTIPMSISMMYLLKQKETFTHNKSVIKKISSLTFGIYLIHPIILETIDYLQFGAKNYNPIISVPIISIAVFILSLAAIWTVSKTPFIRRIV